MLPLPSALPLPKNMRIRFAFGVVSLAGFELEAGALDCFDLEAGALGLEARDRSFARFAVFLVATRFFDIITPSSWRKRVLCDLCELRVFVVREFLDALQPDVGIAVVSGFSRTMFIRSVRLQAGHPRRVMRIPTQSPRFPKYLPSRENQVAEVRHQRQHARSSAAASSAMTNTSVKNRSTAGRSPAISVERSACNRARRDAVGRAAAARRAPPVAPFGRLTSAPTIRARRRPSALRAMFFTRLKSTARAWKSADARSDLEAPRQRGERATATRPRRRTSPRARLRCRSRRCSRA